MLDQLATEIPEVTVAKVNVNHQPDIAQQHRIMSVPTLIVPTGQPVAQVVGFASLLELRK